MGDLALAAVGVIGFLLILPSVPFARSSQDGTEITLSLLFGISLDSAIHGASSTLPYSWRTDPVATVLLGGLVTVHLFSLLISTRSSYETGFRVGFLSGIPLFGWGAVVFLNGLIFQNIPGLVQ